MQAGLDPPAPISGEAKAYHINQRNEGIDLDGVSGALMATQNLQMQTFITNPSSSQNGPQTQIASPPTSGTRCGICTMWRVRWAHSRG